MRLFIKPGIAAFEALLSGFDQTPFATGDTVGLADICLFPQLYNANRWGVDYSDCPRISAVETACKDIAAFKAATPS
jgi:maleylacetoacetate isomerase